MNKQQQKKQRDAFIAKEALQDELTLTKASDGERRLAEYYFILGMNFKPPKALKVVAPMSPYYTTFVKIWNDKYPNLLNMPRDGAKIKSIIVKCESWLRSAGKEISEGSVTGMWLYIVNAIEKTWYHGKDLSIIDSKFNNIVYDLKNGTKRNGYNQNPSTRRWADTI